VYIALGYMNTMVLVDGVMVFESQKKEKTLRPEDEFPDHKIVPPFNAYSPPGDITSSKMIYVNYGREEDFHWLKTEQNVDFEGSVVIARYGKIFRADKVRE